MLGFTLITRFFLPAMLVRVLGIEFIRYVDITIRYDDNITMLSGVHLLRTRHTASRQFTIPREVREKYGMKPLDEIEILSIKPARARKVGTRQLGIGTF